MQWRVDGASESTGQDVTVFVDATTQDEALKSPNLRGVLVSSIVAAPSLGDKAEDVGDAFWVLMGRLALFFLGLIAVGFVVGGSSTLAGSLGLPGEAAGASMICVGLLIFAVMLLVKIYFAVRMRAMRSA